MHAFDTIDVLSLKRYGAWVAIVIYPYLESAGLKTNR